MHVMMHLWLLNMQEWHMKAALYTFLNMYQGQPVYISLFFSANLQAV